jgi:hypothetical protein
MNRTGCRAGFFLYSSPIYLAPDSCFSGEFDYVSS